MEISELKNSSLKELKKQRDDLALALTKIEDAIRILEGNQEKPIDWKNKAYQCLSRQDRFLSTTDILEHIFSDEPEKLEDDRRKRNYISALSFAISSLCKDDTVGRVFVPGHKGYYYGLRTWFKPEVGGMLPEYKEKLDADLWSF